MYVICVCGVYGDRKRQTHTYRARDTQRERGGKMCYREKPVLRAASDPKSIPE